MTPPTPSPEQPEHEEARRPNFKIGADAILRYDDGSCRPASRPEVLLYALLAKAEQEWDDLAEKNRKLSALVVEQEREYHKGRKDAERELERLREALETIASLSFFAEANTFDRDEVLAIVDAALSADTQQREP